jgi:hypothetical protein
MPEEPRLEEQAVSQAVELGINSQIEGADRLDVEVHTDLLKVVQGKADSVAVAGQGVTVQPGVRVEAMELHTDRISINPLSLLFGQVRLDQPIDTIAHLTFTEADLNRALNSDAVRAQLTPVSLNVEGASVSVEMQLPMTIDLQTPSKFGFSGTMRVHESTGDRSIRFQAVICPRTDEQPVLLESFQCEPGQGVSLPFTIALLKKGQELVQSPYLELAGMAVRVKKMTVEPGTLHLEGEAHVYQMPQI